ncbi:MAG TPA: T9SS type A sorting domain-containing protein [Bacteroidia bacterium]|nr:T9SS type A sorting domain-containing protein [Bacteroidia bacterium]
MKTHPLTFAIVLMTFLGASNSEAQPAGIDSLKIIPTNPTTNDTVKVISYTHWGINPCLLTSSSINTVNDSITVVAIHGGFGNLQPCSSIDTLTIGVLNAGNYELIYYLPDTFWAVVFDIDTIIFTVQQASGLNQIDNSDQRIKIFPNPATTEVTINFGKAARYDVQVCNVVGEVLMHRALTPNPSPSGEGSASIDVSKFTPGIYFITITDEEGNRMVRKVVKM